jgi:hypothetical protein
MKPLRFLIPVILLSVVVVKAQTTAPAITDEDLKKYAITMDSVKDMQTSLNQIVAEKVQKNTVMSVARYNELFKIIADEAKLTAAKATSEEIAFVKSIDTLRQENIARINATYQALAKDYVGLKTFNAIKKSLASDEALKAKYESISKEVDSKGGE